VLQQVLENLTEIDGALLLFFNGLSGRNGFIEFFVHKYALL
jgi:hypothetical protein